MKKALWPEATARKISFPTKLPDRYNKGMKYLLLLFFLISPSAHSREAKTLEEILPETTERWEVKEQIVKLVRDPIEQVTINEQCHPLSEKECELNKALKRYLSMELTDEIKSLFAENPKIRPGKIVCSSLLQGEIVVGKKPIRGRFPRYEEFCQFGDQSLITIASLPFYQGPQKYIPEDFPPSEEVKGDLKNRGQSQ